MKSKRMVRILSLVVVLSMILTTAAFAAPGKKDSDREKEKVEIKEEDYNRALLSLIEKEIVKGYGKGDYGLSGNVKRGDVIVMIIRALGLENVDTKELSKEYLDLMVDEEDFEDFKDVENDVYYYGPIKMAKKLGIAKGDGRYFKPNKPVTIQEAIWLISRAEALLGDNTLYSENPDVIVNDLTEKIGEEKLNDFAKRRDVIWMLNYLIEGYELDDVDDRNEEKLIVEFTLKEGEDEVEFKAEEFKNAFDKYADENELKDDDLDFIKFAHNYSYLSYGENEVSLKVNQKYYVSGESFLIDNIKFERTDKKASKTEIPFKAYDDEGNDPYEGIIKITIEKYASVKDLEYTILEGETLQFDKIKFNSSIDEIKFATLPDEYDGTLYYGSKNRKVETDDVYLYSRISRIFYVPEDGFNGITEFKYTATTKDNKSITGNIVINVLDVNFIGKIVEVEMDGQDEEIINFTYKLELKDVQLNDIDFVRFTEPNEGSLWILAAKVDSNTEYNDMSKLDQIVYRSTDEEPDDIEFYAVDLDHFKAYVGTIEIKVVED